MFVKCCNFIICFSETIGKAAKIKIIKTYALKFKIDSFYVEPKLKTLILHI